MAAWFRDKAIESGELASGREYFILEGSGLTGPGYNGYVRFDARPGREESYNGILTYVPVHGGITLACDTEEGDGGMLYGFDTAHCDSGKYPRHDLGWIKHQIEIMEAGIVLAAEFEADYLANKDNAFRASIIQQLVKLQPEQQLSFGSMLNLLIGEL